MNNYEELYDDFKIKTNNDLQNLQNFKTKMLIVFDSNHNQYDNSWKIDNEDLTKTLEVDSKLYSPNSNIPKYAFPIKNSTQEKIQENQEENHSFLEEFFFNTIVPVKKKSKKKANKGKKKIRKGEGSEENFEIKEEVGATSENEYNEIENMKKTESIKMKDRNVYQGLNTPLINSGANYTIPNIPSVNFIPPPSNYSYTMQPAFSKYTTGFNNQFDQGMNVPNFFMNPYFESSRGVMGFPFYSKGNFSNNEQNEKKNGK